MITNISQKISFGTSPLYDVKLKKVEADGDVKFVNAKFSQLVPIDKGDIFAVKEIGKSARKHEKRVLHHISETFLGKMCAAVPCYALELVDETKPLKDRIVALMSTEAFVQNGESVIKVKHLARNTDVADTKEASIVGAGEVSLYGVVKIAKEDMEDDVELVSKESAMNFYEHIGFKREEEPIKCEFRDYFLDSEDYNFFINNIEEKYNFKNE